jgi:hypothetical protein
MEKINNPNTNKIVILNGFSPSMFGHRNVVIEFKRIALEEVKKMIQSGQVVHYIRHPGTVKLLSLSNPNSGVYTYNGERIIMVVLNTPSRGQEAEPSAEDLVCYEVIVHKIE